MKLKLIWIVGLFLLVFFPIGLIHEGLHYLPAYLLGTEPELTFTLTDTRITTALSPSTLGMTIITILPLLVFTIIFLVMFRIKKIRWLAYMFFAWAFAGTWIDISVVLRLWSVVNITPLLPYLHSSSVILLFFAGVISLKRLQNEVKE